MMSHGHFVGQSTFNTFFPLGAPSIQQKQAQQQPLPEIKAKKREVALQSIGVTFNNTQHAALYSHLYFALVGSDCSLVVDCLE